jgi:hypothetical protein
MTVYKKENIMAIVFIFPAFMLLTLIAVAILAIGKPPVEQTGFANTAQSSEQEFELAA